MNLDSLRWCGHCKTRGHHHTDRHPCPTCKGQGRQVPLNEHIETTNCPDCNGTRYEQRTPAELARAEAGDA